MSLRGATVRTTIELDVELDRLLRRRALDRGQSLRVLITEALRAYLDVPSSGLRAPGSAHMPGDGALTAEARAAVVELRALLPSIRSVVASQAEVLDALDAMASELGHRRGAAAALHEVMADLKHADLP